MRRDSWQSWIESDLVSVGRVMIEVTEEDEEVEDGIKVDNLIELFICFWISSVLLFFFLFLFMRLVSFVWNNSKNVHHGQVLVLFSCCLCLVQVDCESWLTDHWCLLPRDDFKVLSSWEWVSNKNEFQVTGSEQSDPDVSYGTDSDPVSRKLYFRPLPTTLE